MGAKRKTKMPIRRVCETWYVAVVNDTPLWPYLELRRCDVKERIEKDRAQLAWASSLRIAKLCVVEVI